MRQVEERRDDLAKGLREDLGWQVNRGTEFDKVAAIFCLNTVKRLKILQFKSHADSLD